MKIKVNDQVLIVAGKDRTKTGKVVRTVAGDNKIVVEGVNLVKKHVKSRGNHPGGIISQENPINASNAMVICPSCNKKTRVSYKVAKNGDKERICQQCKQALDQAIVTTKK